MPFKCFATMKLGHAFYVGRMKYFYTCFIVVGEERSMHVRHILKFLWFFNINK